MDLGLLCCTGCRVVPPMLMFVCSLRYLCACIKESSVLSCYLCACSDLCACSKESSVLSCCCDASTKAYACLHTGTLSAGC